MNIINVIVIIERIFEIRGILINYYDIEDLYNL